MSADAAQRDFVPASPQLWLYDFLVAMLTRESRWRAALLRQVDPKAGDAIADIGCGTATLLALIGRRASSARLIGIDPDARALERARSKLARAGVRAELSIGYARDAGDGYENTEPNGRGVLPELMREVGFCAVEETAVIATPTVSISLDRAQRAA